MESTFNIYILLDELCNILSKFTNKNIVRTNLFLNCIDRQTCIFYIDKLPSNCYVYSPFNNHETKVMDIQLLDYVSENNIGKLNYITFHRINHSIIENTIIKNSSWYPTYVDFANTCLNRSEIFEDFIKLRNFIIIINNLLIKYTDTIFICASLHYNGAESYKTLYSNSNTYKTFIKSKYELN